MSKAVAILLGLLIIPACWAYGDVRRGDTAHYKTARAGEEEASRVVDAWIIADGAEKVRGNAYRWWRMVLRKGNASVLAVRALSEQVPMTSPEAPGDITRYIYSPQPGMALEYVDERTGRALLPELDFKQSFLPRPAPDARYPQGYASTGALLGHAMWLARYPEEPPKADFGDVRALRLRTDLMIGTSRTFKDDGNPRKLPDGNYNYVPWTQQDVEAMIGAGFNYFASVPELRAWMLEQPVFVRGAEAYPDDFYRSNVSTSRMFIDEPMVHLGWTGGVPGLPSGPEMVAQSLRMRVMGHEPLRDRVIAPPYVSLGTLDLLRPKAPSWDTEYWSAWYQLQAGAPGIVHEGRYRHRGYGWEPESLVGQGLEALTDRDMFNCYYAFLRGAARSFNGCWGTSIYGQSEVELRAPALIRAYEMGAKHLWFWTSDHDHHMPFTEQLRLASAVTDYARKRPRPDQKTMLRQAEVGIALPPGYVLSWYGTWGMERERLNPYGVSYGEVSAAAFWEGILCSRRGIEFDFLVDHPGIEGLGYRRLVRVQEDGSVKGSPPWPKARAPKGLKLGLGPASESPINATQSVKADFRIERARGITIDGDLGDWQEAQWITLGEDRWLGDCVNTTVKVQVPDAPLPAAGDMFLGFTFQQLNEDLRRQYGLDFYAHEDVMVITSVAPGSAADEAGIREGDAIVSIAGRKIKYPMHIHQVSREVAKDGRRELKAEVRRNDRSRYQGKPDLSAEVAFLLDDSYLYFGAKVADDVHMQSSRDGDLWRQDSVQIGLDPILDRAAGNYGENNHEIGIALGRGGTQVWRWKGRRGQPVGSPANVLARAERKDGFTLYEAAIPIAELRPFAPDAWPKCGVNVVVNDSDAADERKGRVELAPGAMTHGKHPDQFAVFECAPSGNPRKVSAALFWDRRCMLENGSAQLTVAVSSPETREAILRTELTSLDSPQTQSEVRETVIAVAAEPKQYRLSVSSSSPAGRYRLRVSVTSRSGWKAANEALGVYIYPEADYP